MSDSFQVVGPLEIAVVSGQVGHGLVRQSLCSLAYIELAGHHVRDETGAVFAQELDLTFEAGDGGVQPHRFRVNVTTNCPLLIDWRQSDLKAFDLFRA